ncbi:MAG: hypothetical protein OXP09_08285 [Gammaproteobacteria bacterium]|nr:hypothetical protein [Gammaproteobacteria bacterium]
MAVSLNMGVEGVSYQRSAVESRSGYPESRANLPIGASIPLHVDRVFNLDASDRFLARALSPRIANPYVTVPANYAKLFNDIEAATGRQGGERGESGRILQSARTLLLAMKADFQAFETSRNALIKA